MSYHGPGDYQCDRCNKLFKETASAFGYRVPEYNYFLCIECDQLFKNIYDQLVDDFINDRLPYDNLTQRLIDQYAPVLEKLSKE